jgi:16S rRNA processing protein RimM
MPQKTARRKKTQNGPSPQGNGPSFLAVARIRRPFGVKGELLLELLTGNPRHLNQSAKLYFGADHRECAIVSLRRHGQDYLLRLEGVDDREAAETMRAETIFLRTDEQPPLPEGVYYHYQIEGLQVVTEAGEELGRIKEIIKTGANDVYVVEGPRGEVLLPAIPDVIREVRLPEGKMVVRLLDGLLG